MDSRGIRTLEMNGSATDASAALDAPWYEPDIDRAQLVVLMQRSPAFSIERPLPRYEQPLASQ